MLSRIILPRRHLFTRSNCHLQRSFSFATVVKMSNPSNDALESGPANGKMINLLRGWPCPDLLPVEMLRRAADKVFTDPEVYVPALQYGPDPGYEPLRRALAGWLGRRYQRGGLGGDSGGDSGGSRREEEEMQRMVDEICITGGASQSVACVLQSFTDPAVTRAVWAVEPCYYLACPIFADAGFVGDRLRGVPEDEGGIDTEWLEREMRRVDESWEGSDRPFKEPGPSRKLYRHVIYLVATCGNPSGITTGVERRRKLIEIARRHNALIISDDVYDFLQWPTDPSSSDQVHPLPRLSDLDITLGPTRHDPPGKYFGHAISNGSFSKLCGPGVRTGWVHGTPDFAYGLSQTGSTRSGGAPSQLAAAMVEEIVRSGELDSWVTDKVVPGLRERWGVMKGLLEGAGLEVRREETYGGYFVWVKLPQGVKASGVEKRCRERGVIVAPGGLFSVGGDLEGWVRLTYSWLWMEDLREGVERFLAVVKEMEKMKE